MHGSGLSSDKLTPEQDYMFPTLEPFRLGLTNLAHRPTRRSEQLSLSEQLEGVPDLVRKVRRYRPRIVCFVGKQIAQMFLRGLRGHLGERTTVMLPTGVLGHWTDAGPDVGYGVMNACIEHDDRSTTLFFAAPSTSARVTHHQLPDKIRIMRHITTILTTRSDQPVAVQRITGID